MKMSRGVLMTSLLACAGVSPVLAAAPTDRAYCATLNGSAYGAATGSTATGSAEVLVRPRIRHSTCS